MVSRRQGVEAPSIANQHRARARRGLQRDPPPISPRLHRLRGYRHRRAVHQHLLHREAPVQRELDSAAAPDGDRVLDDRTRERRDPAAQRGRGEPPALPRASLGIGTRSRQEARDQNKASDTGRQRATARVIFAAGSGRRVSSVSSPRLTVMRKPRAGRLPPDGLDDVAGLGRRLAGDTDDHVARSDRRPARRYFRRSPRDQDARRRRIDGDTQAGAVGTGGLGSCLDAEHGIRDTGAKFRAGIRRVPGQRHGDPWSRPGRAAAEARRNRAAGVRSP